MITDGNQRRAVAFGQVEDNVSYLLGAGQVLYRFPPLAYGPLGATDVRTRQAFWRLYSGEGLGRLRDPVE